MDRLLALGVLVCLGGISVVFHVAYRESNAPAMINAFVSFLLVLVPLLVDGIADVLYGIPLGLTPGLSLWIAVAGVAHSYGMLGPYDEIWWWDHLTHTLSAALIAALIYAGVLVSTDHLSISADGSLVWAVVLLLTLLAGVFWELIELLARDVGRQFGVPPVLEHYGRRDTVLDLLFDVVGAVGVLALDVQLFVPMAEVAPGVTVAALAWGIGALVVGSLIMSLVVVIGQAESS